MKKLLPIFMTVLVLTSCEKDKAIDYSVGIEVKDYYTGQPIAGQTVMMEMFKPRSLSGHLPVASKVTDENGKVRFSESYNEDDERGFAFYADIGNGYMTSETIDVENGSEQTIKVKPLVPIAVAIDHTATLDSLMVIVRSMRGHSDQITLLPTDSFDLVLMATPDEENALFIYGYNEGRLDLKAFQKDIYPSLNDTNSLTITIP